MRVRMASFVCVWGGDASWHQAYVDYVTKCSGNHSPLGPELWERPWLQKSKMASSRLSAILKVSLHLFNVFPVTSYTMSSLKTSSEWHRTWSRETPVSKERKKSVALLKTSTPTRCFQEAPHAGNSPNPTWVTYSKRDCHRIGMLLFSHQGKVIDFFSYMHLSLVKVSKPVAFVSPHLGTVHTTNYT